MEKRHIAAFLSFNVCFLVGCDRPPIKPAAGEPTAVATLGEGETLVDVTAESNLNFVHYFGDTEMDNIVESLGSGAAWLDFDGDKDLDLYLLNQNWREGISGIAGPRRSSPNRLFENRGNGSFDEVEGAAGAADDGYSFAVAVGDVDNDGDQDIFVANCGPNHLYINQGDGSFHRSNEIGPEDESCSAGATFFDSDRDGWLDLYIANYLEFDPDYALHYAPDVYPGPLAYEAQADVLLRNTGDGRFEEVTAKAGLQGPMGRAMGVVATDFDADGWTDIFVANDATPNFFFRNQGDGTFEEIGTISGLAYGFQGEATSAMAGVVGDLDNDGRSDLLVTDTTYGSLYRNLGGGQFEDIGVSSGLAAPSGQWVSWGGGFFDYDNDGDSDVFQVNGDLKRVTGRPDLLLANQGDGTFELVDGGQYFRSELPGRGGAFADYDNDGDSDVLVTVLGGRSVLLRNDTENDNHWLGLRLQGVTSNRDGLGAVVTLKAGDRTWTQTHHAATGYLTQSDYRLHFGLGEQGRVDQLTIAWPSGIDDEFEDLEVDRYWTVVEGKGTE